MRILFRNHLWLSLCPLLESFRRCTVVSHCSRIFLRLSSIVSLISRYLVLLGLIEVSCIRYHVSGLLTVIATGFGSKPGFVPLFPSAPTTILVTTLPICPMSPFSSAYRDEFSRGYVVVSQSYERGLKPDIRPVLRSTEADRVSS